MAGSGDANADARIAGIVPGEEPVPFVRRGCEEAAVTLIERVTEAGNHLAVCRATSKESMVVQVVFHMFEKSRNYAVPLRVLLPRAPMRRLVSRDRLVVLSQHFQQLRASLRQPLDDGGRPLCRPEHRALDEAGVGQEFDLAGRIAPGDVQFTARLLFSRAQ